MNESSSGPRAARILSVATAVPDHVLEQSAVEELGRRIFTKRPDTFERLAGAYRNAGIERRYSCVPIEWYEEPRGWKDQNALYVENALKLLERAAGEALDTAGLVPDDIDGLITVSSTGLAVPSLDARLMARMSFRRNTERLPIFGLGCAGGVLGLARGAAQARANPGSTWLVLVVELCGLTFRAVDLSKSNIIATALFGDGVAAMILKTSGVGPKIRAWGEHCWPNSLDIMGWRIEEDGFGVQFSRDIPNLVRHDLRVAIDEFLERNALARESIDHFLFHPGGAKVLTALEECLDLKDGELADARDILRTHGNMSAATVLFVLERVLRRREQGIALLGALGPGFTAGFMALDLAG